MVAFYQHNWEDNREVSADKTGHNLRIASYNWPSGCDPDKGNTVEELLETAFALEDVPDDAFGVFGGSTSKGYLVIIKSFLFPINKKFTGAEFFETLQELNQKWELDL